MIFSNAKIIFPNEIRDDLELVIRDGKIAELRPRTNEIAVNLDGNFLTPGLIDLHVHGALGCDAMDSAQESFRTICDFHASGGTTSLLLTTTTAPLEKIEAVLREIGDCKLPQLLGAHLEGPFISRARHGAQRAEFIRDPEPKFWHDAIKRVTLAPELPGALDFIDELRARKISISGGHSDAWDEEARAGFERGMRSVTHTFNCMSSARRRGRERVAGLLEFALSEPLIFCELIADGHHVSPTLMKMLYRAKGADGICLVTDATAGAGLTSGSHFQLGGLDCKVTDGVALLADGSALAGSTSRMINLIRNAIRQIKIPIHEAITMATQTPARVLGIENRKGVLVSGADADFVVLSPELEVVETFVAGKSIFRSKSETARSRARRPAG